MRVDCFIDTNLFIYQLEAADLNKFQIANQIIRNGVQNRQACISFQVVQECLNVIRQKSELTLSIEDTKKYLDAVLFPLWKIMPTTHLYIKSLHIQNRYRYGFYDSLIIAAAWEAGCNTLYSEDLQHGQQIEGLRIVNPFLQGQVEYV